MMLSKDDVVEFKLTFQEVIKDLTENPELRDMGEINDHLSRVLLYNVPDGKHTRGLAAILAYRYFTTTDLTEEDIKLSYILGWCVEILQAFALVADDIMDGSETRRGKACWYKVEDIGITAINDAILIENSMYQILNKHFSQKSYYNGLLTIFRNMIYKTIYGQSLDTRTALKKNLDEFTVERYSAIVKYKTSYYTFVGPVQAAMIIAGVTDAHLFKEVETVMLEMGHYFQVQDDFLDCFGDEQETGKMGTDIQDCKCSWIFITAMQNANPTQKEIIKENYGKPEKENIDRVKQLYNELDLTGKYHLYSEKTFNLISNHIQQMSTAIPKQLFTTLLDKINGRTK